MARPPSHRGFSLIELMIAMAVLTVGMLAMWHLHVFGLTATAAGRRHTVAVALARELASGLERLAFSDPLLSYNYVGQGGTTAPPSSALFGALVQGDGTLRTGAHDWSDTQAVPGVRLDTEMREQADVGAREAAATAGVAYQRRWTVWDMVSPQPGAAGTTPGVKVVAVSVVWRDPPFDRPREVVLYTQVANPGAIITGLASSP
jgi:prepilin-type N-terminal cleavage/methylation domain-containing protein